MAKNIRRIKLEDLEQVLHISELLPEWFDIDARTRAIPIDIRFQEVLLAEQNDQILGFIALFIAEGRVNIAWLGVHPDYHRQGIGGLLIKAAEDYCRSIGVKELATYTLGASVDYTPYDATRAFYHKQGFRVYQRSHTDNPGCPEEIRLKKWVE
jgi:GNAT superfamily N-acetyltransferase